MENSEHVLIQMEQLADSLTGKLESLPPLSNHCSIYKVPEPRRRLHPRYYTPEMVSIGPYHHGKEELKAMEEYKQRYLKYFLQRTEVSLSRFLVFIKEREEKLRSCYAETIPLESNEFITMVLMDAVFLIEFFLICYSKDFKTHDDRIFGISNLNMTVRYDFWLLENQLPLFILNELFDLAKTSAHDDCYNEISFGVILISWFRRYTLSFIPVEENLLENNFSEAKHLLDMLLLCIHPSKAGAQIGLKDLNLPGAKQLHQAGVKFKSVSRKNLLDIRFNEEILEIPFLAVYERSELLLRNLLAFESMHHPTGYLNDYLILMGFLINSQKDAELLIQKGIVGPGHSDLLPTIFGRLCKECILEDHGFHYSGIADNLQKHCKMPRNKWKANLKQNYFNTPWASISVIAAAVLLVFTITQTISSLTAL